MPDDRTVDYIRALMQWTLDGCDPEKAERLNELWQAIPMQDRRLLERRGLKNSHDPTGRRQGTH